LYLYTKKVLTTKLTSEALNRLSEEEALNGPKIKVCAILENIRSLHNIGSFFRTADAFGLEKLYLAGYTATPPNREIEKTALGATKSVPWEQAALSEIYSKLLSEGYTIIAIEQTSNSVKVQDFKFDPSKKYALIFGNEVRGVEENSVKMADFCVEIPQIGAKHSLNVSVCGGILLWEAFKNLYLH
jgi:23S rRNA (guanosine2251-2'-O)-methyltransferase